MITPTEVIGLSAERIPLKKVIRQMQNPTKEKVKQMYGDIGVDIFEGKNKITILSDKDFAKSKSLSERFHSWLFGDKKYDFEENDCVKDLVLKYACNKKFGTYTEIEEKFGKEGRRIADIYRVIGYFCY